MPRAAGKHITSLVVLVGLLTLSVAHATPIPGGLQEARGTATHYQIIGGEGAYLATGPNQWNLVCTSCDVFITFSQLADGITVQGAAVTLTTPGTYELRDFTGTLVFGYNAPHDMTTLVLGHGEVDPQ